MFNGSIYYVFIFALTLYGSQLSEYLFFLKYIPFRHSSIHIGSTGRIAICNSFSLFSFRRETRPTQRFYIYWFLLPEKLNIWVIKLTVWQCLPYTFDEVILIWVTSNCLGAISGSFCMVVRPIRS